MPGLKVNQFGGMLPAWDDRLLPENQGADANNTYLYTGALQGWRKPKLLRALTNSAAKFVYRVPTQTRSIASAYLAFTSNPVAGRTVKIGESTYTFVAAVVDAYDVLLGSDATHSAQNLWAALTLNGVFGQQFGVGTCANGDVTPNAEKVGLPYSNVAGTNAPGAGTLFLIPCSPQGTQKATSVSCLPSATDAGAKFRGVIYDNAAGIPGSLLAAGNEVIGCTAGTAVDSAFSVPPTLIGGNTYWIGFLADTSVALHLADTGLNSSLASLPYPAAAPASAPAMSPLHADWQIWCDLALFQTSDPEVLLTTGFSGDPVIKVQAPDFGAAYNTTPLANTGSELVWTYDLVSLAHTTTTLLGGTNTTLDASITGASTWLEFVDPDTNVVKSPVVDDSFQRYYFASPSQPPQYNTYDRIVNGDPNFLLGIPAPGCTPSLAVAQGGDAATVGLPESSSDNNSAPGGNKIIFLQVTPNGAASLNDVALMPAADSATAKFIGLLFSDDNGAPGTLIAAGEQQVGAVSGVAVVSPFAIPPGLLVNQPYWIAMMLDTSIAIQLADDVFTHGAVASYTYTSGAPDTAPAVTTNQVDWQLWGDLTSQAVLEVRAYVYTWVSAYGEEGPPSPPTTGTGWSNSTWTVGLFTPSVDELGTTRNIAKTRLYRTITSTGGDTTYFFVAEFDVTTGTYVDTIPDSTVALNAELQSLTWTAPPEGLQGMVSLPNGIIAGFRANEIWFCEPYRPHAWPAGYVVTTEYPIVGLGAAGQTVVACTEGQPHIVYGTTPAVMSAKKVEIKEPCLSRGSIMSTDNGVVYMSANGLVSVSASGQATNATENWITREKWRQLTPQKNVRAVKHITAYFAFGTINGTDHSVAQQGFSIEASSDNMSFSIWPQAGGHRVGFSKLAAPNDFDIDNVEIDPWSGVCMIVQNGEVYYYDFSDTDFLPTVYTWRSKKFQQQAKKNFQALRVWFDIPPGLPAKPVTRTTADIFDDIPFVAPMYGVVRVFVDGNLLMARELRFSSELMRVPSGVKGETWQLEFEGVVSISNAQIATSVHELAGL